MRNLLLFVLFAFLAVSCEKKEDPIPEPQLTYMPLEIGNYWVYENKLIQQDVTKTPSEELESIVIARDTLLRGEKYFVLEGNQMGYNNDWGVISILRDSLSYLVNENGEILFAENHFGEVLRTRYEIQNNDTLVMLESVMQEVPVSVALPGGNFDALNFQTTATVFIENPEGDALTLDNMYAKDVGKVFQSYLFVMSLSRLEKRLVRYHTEN